MNEPHPWPLRQPEQPDPGEQVMPEVVFVSTLEPKDRRDKLVELLAELAKHIRGDRATCSSRCTARSARTRARSWSSRGTPRSRRTKSTARGRAARYPGLASSSQRLPLLPSCSNRSRSGTTRRSNGGSVPQRLSYSLATSRGPTGPLHRTSRSGRPQPSARLNASTQRIGDQDFTGVGAGFTLRGQHSSGAASAACSPAQVAHHSQRSEREHGATPRDRLVR